MPKQKRQYTRVDAELVKKVREMSEKFPEMGATEMAEFTGWASASTLGKIIKGEYDHLIGIEATPPQDVMIDLMMANNALLADIATMLVNLGECTKHQPTKETEAKFRNRIKANRREPKETEEASS